MDMALALDARVQAPVFQLDVITPRSLSSRASAEARGLPHDDNRLARDSAAGLEAEAQPHEARVTVETSRDVSFSVAVWLCDLAMLHDLTISGVDQDGLLSERHLAEAPLFRSGRPVLIVPREHAGGFQGGRIAVAWDRSAPAGRAIAESLPLHAKADDVVLLMIGGDENFDTVLRTDDVIRTLGQRGVRARVREQQRWG